jgi:IS5 family transposase
MRPRLNNQSQFRFQATATLKITESYYGRYERIDAILAEHPELVELIHGDVAEPLDCERAADATGADCYKCASETVLRMVICQTIEGCSLREIVVRIDDSEFLRRFVRVYNDPMIDYSTFCRLRNRITPETWKHINNTLARTAVDQGDISGERIRLDTTAVETNIHWPTDSSLLGDCYRTLARLVESMGSLDPDLADGRRLLRRKVKRLVQKIGRRSRGKNADAEARREALKPLYLQLITLVYNLDDRCADIVRGAVDKIARQAYPDALRDLVAACMGEMIHFRRLTDLVMKQAHQRVIEGRPVPNDQKIFSIFEAHTELLIRGKAGKPIEFGHMIQIQQVGEKFITHYDVFSHKPVEHELVEPAIERHRELFGDYPKALTADKGYYGSSAQLAALRETIDLVAINKKGKRSEEEERRESDPFFRHAQRFRAGVEGTISYLKRTLGLARCYVKGWTHYAATVGATIFVHNLLILARE